jgi:hypothetical protein
MDFRSLLALSLLVSACSPQTLRCDGRLQPINAPLPVHAPQPVPSQPPPAAPAAGAP